MKYLLTATLVVALSGATAHAKQHNQGTLNDVEDTTLSAPQSAGGSLAPVGQRGLTVVGSGKTIGKVAMNTPTSAALDKGAADNRTGNSGTSQNINRGAKQDLAQTKTQDICPSGKVTLSFPPNGPVIVRSERTGKTFKATVSDDIGPLQRGEFVNSKFRGVGAKDIFKNLDRFVKLNIVGGDKVSIRSMGATSTDYYVSDEIMRGRIDASGLDAQMDQMWIQALPNGEFCGNVGGGGGGGGGGGQGAQGQQAQNKTKKAGAAAGGV